MKHSKKKFLKSSKIGDDVADVLNSAAVDENAIVEFKKKNFDGMYALIHTDGNEVIQAFKYTDSATKTYFIPEPNPIVIYFEMGRFYFRKIDESKINLFIELDNLNKTYMKS
jgi:hypothetical protein